VITHQLSGIIVEEMKLLESCGNLLSSFGPKNKAVLIEKTMKLVVECWSEMRAKDMSREFGDRQDRILGQERPRTFLINGFLIDIDIGARNLILIAYELAKVIDRRIVLGLAAVDLESGADLHVHRPIQRVKVPRLRTFHV
jgi:hypothetical protein